MLRRLAGLVLAAFLGGSLWGAGALAGQAASPPLAGHGAIAGRVVDAQTLEPIAGARLELLLDGASAAGDSSGDRAARRTLSDGSGGYRFAALEPTRYRLRVERLGYLTRSVDVELRSGQVTALSVGLEVAPIRLPRIEVIGALPAPFERSRDASAGLTDSRVRVARLRQEAYLAGDVREMTHREVIESITLGEPDIFRALQRTPGVATRDDYTATLWTRGASWDQTRVYFDGLELYNPTHAGWLFSAVNPDAIGSVLFQPGYRSPVWGEGIAAVLDLRTRSGTPGRAIGGAAEISPASARIALDGTSPDGSLAWMAAARRTYVDLLTDLIRGLGGDDELVVPYDFTDLALRVDGRSEDGWGFEASSILEWDRLRGDIPGIVTGNRGRWGNRAGRVTLIAPLRGFRRLEPLEVRFTAGQTLFGTEVVRDTVRSLTSRSVPLPDLRNDVTHQTVGVQVRPAGRDSLRWGLGYQAIRDEIRYVGPYSLLGILTAVDEPVPTTDYTDRLLHSAFWGERRWIPQRRLELVTGLRVEVGDDVHNGGRVRWAPRLAARWAVDAETRVSAAWSRAFQYSQDVSPAAGPVGPQLHLSAIWLLATAFPARPLARADVATLGIERWIGEGWLASANAYRRDGSGLLIPNPDSGAVFTGRDPDAVATNRASGVELSLRRLAGRWTGSAGYSYGTSDMVSVVGTGAGAIRYAFPASSEIRHAVDVTGSARLGERFRLGGAFTFGSGVPFTRLVLPDTAGFQPAPILEAPNRERSPSYASLDLMLEYTTTVGSWEVAVYGQLRNVLDRKNAVTYLGSRDCGPVGFRAGLSAGNIDCEGVVGGVKDSFQDGLPRLPMIGARVLF